MSGECESILHSHVPHIRQRYNWDCGVTCVLMLLDEATRNKLLEDFERICYEEGFGQSTWTIDLCYLLKRFNIDHRMYTIHAGVNEEYIHEKYYNRIIDKDRERVVHRFTEAPKLGIKYNIRHISHEELLGLLQRGPVVLLVDQSKLAKRDLVAELGCCLGHSYKGHYILLIGYDLSRGVFFARDPASRSDIDAITFRRIHDARTALGTDHDAIAISFTR